MSKKRKFRNGDKVVVFNHRVEEIKNPAIIHKTGVVIGASRTNNGKLCVEFDEGPLVGCGMGNSLRIVGKPFSCYWVHEDYLRENTEEVLREIEARKEQIEQERIDDWYGPEAYA